MMNSSGPSRLPPSCGPGVSYRPLVPSGYPGFQATTYASRSYTGLAPGYTYQFPGKSCWVTLCRQHAPSPQAVLTPRGGGVWGAWLGVHWRLGRKGMSEEGSPPPPSTPSTEAESRGASCGTAWYSSRPAVHSLSVSSLPRTPTRLQDCHFYQRQHWTCSGDFPKGHCESGRYKPT